MVKKSTSIILIILMLCLQSVAQQKLRVMMSTDFPPFPVTNSDPDDVQSMVRFLLYSNEFDVEGLIASAGTFNMVAEKENILAVLDKYDQVDETLRTHDIDYPTADYLRSVTYEGLGNNHNISISWGCTASSWSNIIGSGRDSEASNAIIAAADKPDSRPIYIGVWGGPREIAQAIWKVQNTRSQSELDAFISKLRVFLIACQDGTHGWLMDNFPNLFIIESRTTYQGMFGVDNQSWAETNIINNHGPLCAIYPPQAIAGPGVIEGDSPTFLYLASANRGINDPENPTQPSWGGQYVRDGNTNHYIDGPGQSTISMWSNDFQEEFKERADWCVTPLSTPIVNITSPANGASFLVGDTINIEATATAQEGTISQVEFFVDGNTIGIDTSAPYTSTYTNATGGTHSISAVATDTQSDTGAASIQITVNIPQEPYGGTPATIPGTIEAEHFDVGGNGSAYFDDSAGSETGNAFRNDEDVDIEDCTDTNGGHNIGYWTAGEWLEYTVNVASAGTYNLDLRVACNGDGRTMSIDMGSSQIASDITIPNTGGWQTWQTITVNNVLLNAGQQIMRISIGDTDYINLNHVTFVSTGSNQFPIANAGSDQTLTDNDNDGNETVTLNGSESSDSDGSITSYIWSENGSQIATGINPTVNLSVGIHQITLTVTDNDGDTATDSVTITVNSETSNDGQIWLEAECGNVGSLWNTISDSNASNDSYVTIQSGNNSTDSAPTNNNGQITYTFNISESGTYTLWARVITPNANDDSFWLQMDGGSWYLWNQIGPHSSWTWEQPQSYTLNAGSHTFTIGYREDGALLDKLYISNTSNTPTGEGNSANNCDAVNIPVTGISVAPTSTSINVGNSTQLNATITPSNASNTNVTWSSSNSSVASVNASGVVSAISQGTATITATSEDEGFTANANITVSDGTTTSTIRIEESTTGFCGVEGTIDSNHTGFTGIGFANTDNADGNGISWSVNIPGSGTYSLVWKYANEGGSNRNGEVLINGSSVVSNVDFIDTGAWSSWTNSSQISVSLLAGNNTIRLEATSGSGLPNIDYIEISGNNPSASTCNSNAIQQSAKTLTNTSAQTNIEAFKVTPNPVKTKLSIEINKKLESDAHLLLYDNIGRLIIDKPIENKVLNLDMGDLHSGIYLIRITNAKTSIVKRIIKK